MANRFIEINGELFSSQDALKHRIREIVARHGDNEPIADPDRSFVLAVLDRHPSRERKIGVGVAGLTVRTIPPYGQRCFWLRRVDGSETDFSWLECLKPSTHRQKVLSALRHAVSGQTSAFRVESFAGRRELTCPLTGEPITEASCHVDHAPPLTFESLVDTFLIEQDRSLDLIEVCIHGDGDVTDILADGQLARAWQDFHRRNAKLRVTSVRGNLSISGKALPSPPASLMPGPDGEPCPHCGSTATREEPATTGPHAGKLLCRRCGRFLKFLPKWGDAQAPGPPPPELLSAILDRIPRSDLDGSPQQIYWARMVRDRMIRDGVRAGSLNVLLLPFVADATWFIAQDRKRRPVERVHWPSVGQLTVATPHPETDPSINPDEDF